MVYESQVYELEPRYGQQESFYGKARVGLHWNGARTLYSYGKPICTMIGDAIIRHDGSCSDTTARHIKAFCGLAAREFDSLRGEVEYSSFREEIDRMSTRTMQEIEILERFDGLEELTEEQERFLTDCIIPHYMFYDRNAKLAHCSGCGEDIDFDAVKAVRNKKEITCPKCGRKTVGRCLSYGHNFSDGGTGVIMQRLGDDIVIRYYDVRRSYVKDFRRPYGVLDEVVRDVIHGDGVPELYDRRERWQLVSRLVSSASKKGWHFAHHVRLDDKNISLYTDNLDDVLRGTRYEHSELKTFAANVMVSGNPWVYGNYLDKYESTPMWEYLMKMGMYGFASSLWEKAEREYYWGGEKITDPKAKTLQDMLRITRPQLAELKENPDTPWTCLNYLQKGMTFEQYRSYCTEDFNGYGNLLDEFINIFPWKTQNPAKFARWRDEDRNADMRTYIDYLRMAKDIGWDTRSDFILYPRDLKKSHDTATKVYNERKQEIQDAKMGELAKAMEAAFAYSGKKLQIVVPTTASDIANEGVTLHHCVGTYIDKVCERKTAILFVRSLAEQGKPFYTMEVCNGRLVQCRGMNNCGMTDDVKRFVASFCKAKHIEMAA